MLFVTMILVFLLLFGLPLYGLRQGSSAVFFVGLGITLAGLLVSLLAPPLANAVDLAHRHSTTANVGLWTILLLTPLSLLAVPVGYWLHRIWLWSFEPFDWVPALLLGITFGIIGARFYLGALLQTYAGMPEHANLQASVVVQQVYYLHSWHALQHWVVTLSNSAQLGM